MPVERINGGQFALIPKNVLYDDHIPATAKLLYGEIYRLSSAAGYCRATNRDFMGILRCSENTVSNLIASLKDAGHIRVTMIRRPDIAGGFQRRIFCGQELAAEDPPDDQDGGIPKICDPPKNLGGVPPKTCDSTIKKENKRNTPISPEVLERVSGYSDGDAELRDAILGLVENRRAMGASKAVKTARAISGILRELDKLSNGNRELKLRLLEKATTSNWLTVYPLKSDEMLRQQAQEPERGGRFL